MYACRSQNDSVLKNTRGPSYHQNQLAVTGHYCTNNYTAVVAVGDLTLRRRSNTQVNRTSVVLILLPAHIRNGGVWVEMGDNTYYVSFKLYTSVSAQYLRSIMIHDIQQ